MCFRPFGILCAYNNIELIQALLDKPISKRKIVYDLRVFYNNYVHFLMAHLIHGLHKESSNFSYTCIWCV